VRRSEPPRSAASVKPPRPRPKLARPDEADFVRALLWSCRDEIPLEPSFWGDPVDAWLEERCRRRRIWVVRDTGDVVGAAVIHHGAGARARAGDWAEVKYLVVAPTHRRRRIGRALLSRIMATWSALRAFANVKNRPIRQLLEQQGFVQHGAITFGGWIRYWWPHPVSMAPQASPWPPQDALERKSRGDPR